MSINIQPEDQAVFDRLKSSGGVTAELRRVITQGFNRCNRCGSRILSGRPAFAGYDAENTPLLACADCAQSHMIRLATPVYPSQNLDISIPDETTLWRYMDFAKFAAMLSQRGLYMPRADMMDDRFEGALGLASREADWDNYHLDYYRKIVAGPGPDGRPSRWSANEVEVHAQRLLRETKAASAESRSFQISCWHANRGESEAQWRLYCPPPTFGVALRSTVGRLWDALAKEPKAVVGQIHYLDFNRSFAVTGRDRIFCKRASLSHECEVRAVIRDHAQDPAPGRLICCDLGALIDAVVLSPFAPTWFEGVVAEVIGKFDFHFPTQRSELLEMPFY